MYSSTVHGRSEFCKSRMYLQNRELFTEYSDAYQIESVFEIVYIWLKCTCY
jgi:hypothetical protein